MMHERDSSCRHGTARMPMCHKIIRGRNVNRSEKTDPCNDSRIAEVVDSLYDPANRPVAEGSNSGIEFDIVHRLVGRNLAESLLYDVTMSRALDTELKQTLKTDIQRLPDTGTAAGDVKNDDIGVIFLHPCTEFFRPVHRPTINQPYRDLRRWKPELLLHVLEIRRDDVVDEQVHGVVVRPVRRSPRVEHDITECDGLAVPQGPWGWAGRRRPPLKDGLHRKELPAGGNGRYKRKRTLLFLPDHGDLFRTALSPGRARTLLINDLSLVGIDDERGGDGVITNSVSQAEERLLENFLMVSRELLSGLRGTSLTPTECIAKIAPCK